jgi:RNA polymerase sigma-70 factor (ECF subfamily)
MNPTPFSAAAPDPLEAAHLAAARAGDHQEFESLVEPYRRALQVHCYRILGSLQDAEDLVQETMLRAWRRLETFEGRGSLRAWLYKIATNACFDALAKRPRRTLPESIYPPADPHAAIRPPVDEPLWLEPYPDEWLGQDIIGTEARYTQRESVSLAFLAAVQLLPPRQRAVLILRDVLDCRAGEVSQILELTVPAVNSALHRARVTLNKHYPAGTREAARPIPEDTATRLLLDRYVKAWETADVSGLVALLKEEASFTMPPVPSWYSGSAAIEAVLNAVVFSGPAPDRWRLLPTRANARPAFAVYQSGADGRQYLPFGIQVLTLDQHTRGVKIAGVTTFLNPALFSRFGFASKLSRED